MNALFELLGITLTKSDYLKLLENGSTFDDYEVTEYTRIDRELVSLLPKFNSTPAREWLQKIQFAKVWKDVGFDENELDDLDAIAFLRSKRDQEDEEAFYNALKAIEYYPGYGLQELYGVVVYTDGTWLSRWEYDGSEGWEKNSLPQEEDYL